MNSEIYTCPQTCFTKVGTSEKEQIERLRKGEIDNIEVPVRIRGHKVLFSPVGNYEENPYVIISGKTPSPGTQKKFIGHLKAGESLFEACFASIYSNMRDNLFSYLNAIGLFDYLSEEIAKLKCLDITGFKSNPKRNSPLSL